MTARFYMAIAVGAVVLCQACQQGQRSPTSPASSPAASADGWRQTFAVKKADLGPTGSNLYFNFEAGTKLHYKEGGATLTISVLNETKVVDGVTTRIIEEREEEDGALKEISRNYFAIDRTTSDLYYFGEDVDIYKDGKVVSHDGAWLSGVNGAHFGLMMPAHPKAGDRFYQEIAPGVAMDRAEIVSIDEKVTTPAGTFERCLQVKETTPLEKDVSRKWYAPGVGMLKDGELSLVGPLPKKR